MPKEPHALSCAWHLSPAWRFENVNLPGWLLKTPYQLLCPRLLTKTLFPCPVDPKDAPALHSLLTLSLILSSSPFLPSLARNGNMIVALLHAAHSAPTWDRQHGKVKGIQNRELMSMIMGWAPQLMELTQALRTTPTVWVQSLAPSLTSCVT